MFVHVSIDHSNGRLMLGRIANTPMMVNV